MCLEIDLGLFYFAAVINLDQSLFSFLNFCL